MRVVVGELKQETNTFVPYVTSLEAFEAWHLYEGEQILAQPRDANWEVNGFVDVLDGAGIEIIPTIATMAMSGGRVEQATFDELLNRLLTRIEAAKPFDGVCLALHGAMSTEEHDDADGVIIDAVRQLIGPEIPLAISMDLHGNLTERCVRGADAIVGFKTSPHIDHRDTGQRAARILVDALHGKVKPVTRMVKIPMVTPASPHRHEIEGPFKRLMDASRQIEQGSILSATVFAVQPWLDIEDFGYSAVVVADRDENLALASARDIAAQVWNEREALCAIDLVQPDTAIARALAQDAGPVILSDLADGNGAGSPGDATAIIAALLRAHPTKSALCNIRDAEAASVAFEAGVGADVDVMVGGKLDHIYNQPVRITGTVEFAGPARFRFGGAGYTGLAQDMGLSAVIRQGKLRLAITSNSVFWIDPEPYRAVGLEPSDAHIVVVKSAIQFRSGFVGMAQGIMLLDTPGMSSDHLEIYDFDRIPRPLYPFDRNTRFHPG